MANRQSPVRYSDEINDKLIKWMNETGYNIVQINGQRISSWPFGVRKPSRGCEVFVGKIPRDCYEDELFPVFQRMGHIHELRLMMMFSGTNRGYAFVMYERLQDAQRAVNQLDNYEIRRGQRIGVLPCVNNCRLFVGCFEADERVETRVQEVLRTETEHVVSVSRRAGRSGRWYLLVEYSNHRAAAIARRELTPRRNQLFGARVIVDWEIPLDKRGRKMALEQRRVLKTGVGNHVLKLFKPIGDPYFSNIKARENLFPDRGMKINSNMQPPASQLNQSMAHCNSNDDMWLQNMSTHQGASYWPPDIVHLNALNQSPSNDCEWYPDAPVNRRPVTRQTSQELCSNSNCWQDANSFGRDANNNNLLTCAYRHPSPRAPQGLMRSMDSGLYSDPECQRPLSSDSTGSGGSSFSQSNWDGSTTSSSSNGSASNLCSISWDQGLPKEGNDCRYSAVEKKLQVKSGRGIVNSQSQLPSMQTDQSTSLFSMDFHGNKTGIWSSRFQSHEDHELIDNLFTKDNSSSNESKNEYQEINLSLRALSLSSSGCSTNNSFVRAIQPPSLFGIPTRGPGSPGLRKCF